MIKTQSVGSYETLHNIQIGRAGIGSVPAAFLKTYTRDGSLQVSGAATLPQGYEQ